jgi:hypothetical protein
MSKPKTLGELQAPFELLAAKNKRSWYTRSEELDRIVLFLGKDRAIDSIFRSDIAAFDAWMFEFKGYSPATRRMTIQCGARWYTWMEDHEHIEFNFNPFLRYLRKKEKPLE